MRKHGQFTEGSYYHVFNRGVDKRNITMSRKDSERFLQSITEFNTIKPIGSIFQNSFKEGLLSGPTTKLVDIIAFCLNPNHYHMLLTPLVPYGIEKFMHRFGTGFTRFFNEKHERSGALFQGRFKSSHICSDQDLLHIASYINLNDKVHQLSSPTTKLVRSSWGEYMQESRKPIICNKDIILGQFNSIKGYEKYAKESLRYILENRYSIESLALNLLAKEEYPEMFEKQKLRST